MFSELYNAYLDLFERSVAASSHHFHFLVWLTPAVFLIAGFLLKKHTSLFASHAWWQAGMLVLNVGIVLAVIIPIIGYIDHKVHHASTGEYVPTEQEMKQAFIAEMGREPTKVELNERMEAAEHTAIGRTMMPYLIDVLIVLLYLGFVAATVFMYLKPTFGMSIVFYCLSGLVYMCILAVYLLMSYLKTHPIMF